MTFQTPIFSTAIVTDNAMAAANGSLLFTLEASTLAFDALLDTLHHSLAQRAAREAAFYASASGCDFDQSRRHFLGPIHFTSDGWALESSDTFQEDYSDLPDLIEFDNHLKCSRNEGRWMVNSPKVRRHLIKLKSACGQVGDTFWGAAVASKGGTRWLYIDNQPVTALPTHNKDLHFVHHCGSPLAYFPPSYLTSPIYCLQFHQISLDSQPGSNKPTAGRLVSELSRMVEDLFSPDNYELGILLCRLGVAIKFQIFGGKKRTELEAGIS
ncbi:hypothetical protein DFH08DRAFT_812542 [Mycena albidolilacea]|uniref:Uncharacterized protein n=1 Tax=Mycena albidolilacea TaxID=1033008 RepID=A0AAD6ZTM9_9AGAR|nr:hypothetical protein DFH08DRAFT_812542 [Mycena albidolilacea]